MFSASNDRYIYIYKYIYIIYIIRKRPTGSNRPVHDKHRVFFTLETGDRFSTRKKNKNRKLNQELQTRFLASYPKPFQETHQGEATGRSESERLTDYTFKSGGSGKGTRGVPQTESERAPSTYSCAGHKRPGKDGGWGGVGRK